MSHTEPWESWHMTNSGEEGQEAEQIRESRPVNIWYVVHRERIDNEDKYVTTDGKGTKPKIMTQTQALTQLVHTDGMRTTHRRAAKTMRKSAIQTAEGTAVVWSLKASTLKQTEVLSSTRDTQS